MLSYLGILFYLVICEEGEERMNFAIWYGLPNTDSIASVSGRATANTPGKLLRIVSLL